MSLATRLSDLATRIATEMKSLRTLINGNALDLSSLTTTTKTNLVAAINELVAAMGDAGASIDDATISTLAVWSSNKTDDEIDTRVSAAVNALLDGAPTAYDTLKELSDKLGSEDSAIAELVTSIAGKADDTAVVKLTGNQSVGGVKTFTSAPVVPDDSFAIAKIVGLITALGNKVDSTAVGNTDINLVTVFEAGLV